MEMRVNKYLSSAGVCSRREADRMVQEGRVTVNGVTAQMGSKIADGDEVCADGKKISLQEKEILLVFHKPVGIVCTTTDKQGQNNIVDYIGYPQRIYPVGRLDKDSEGLILMTNNGAIMDQILRSVNGHEKEYIVTINKSVTKEFIQKMSFGIYIEELERTTNPCKVEKISDKTFRIILTQGLNRQIRRMCELCGAKVTRLQRIRVMNIELGDLPVGQFRDVTKQEYDMLRNMLEK